MSVLDERHIQDLIDAWFDGVLTVAEKAELEQVLLVSPRARTQFWATAQVHALLRADGESHTAYASLGVEDTPVRQGRNQAGVSTRRRTVWRRVWWMAAAAAVLLLGGIAIWQSVPLLSGVADCRLPIATASASPVKLVSQTGIKGLDFPDTLPGTLRLRSGEIVVRLESGVELTVLGPADLRILDCMQVRLERGRLLANVPHWATGFRVRTADLDVCDLGTVFSVSVDFPVTDVFVFKGRVQVDEAGHGGIGNSTSGESVGLCGAGEGVRAEAGERPVKFAADWPAAKKVFASVRDQAATVKAASAFAAAEKIADLWVAGYLPRELARLEARRLAAASALKIPFRKTAWVRPAASRQQETSNMKTTSAAAVLTAAAVAMGAQMAGAVSETVPLFVAPQLNRGWSTVFTNEVPLKWNWNAAATHAELEIAGMNGGVTTNFTTAVSNWVWQAFASGVPAAEDVYDLTLTFYNAGEVVVGVQTSRLAVVKGAFGEASVDPGPSDRKWTSIRENSAIPYDAGWAESTAAATNSRLVIAKVGGSTKTNALADASGYYGWKIKRSDWGYGTFRLALTFPGTEGEWDAALTRPVDGTTIGIR